jgi:DNA-binding CsgD family transcriptional regulator
MFKKSKAGLIDLNTSSYQYASSQLDTFNQICKPLYDLGISHFKYIKMYKTGAYLELVNNLDYLRAILGSMESLGPCYASTLNKGTATPFGTKSKFVLMSHDMNKLYREHDIPTQFNIDFGMQNHFYTYKAISDDCVELYGFYIQNNSTDYAYQFYMEHIALLDRFITYFAEKTKVITDTSNRSKLAYVKKTFDQYNQFCNQAPDEKIKSFLQSTQTQKKIIIGKNGVVYLSQKEFDCLEYSAQGYTAKGIARILNISPRTVEHHMNKIKTKTDLRSKERLIASFLNSVY